MLDANEKEEITKYISQNNELVYFGLEHFLPSYSNILDMEEKESVALLSIYNTTKDDKFAILIAKKLLELGIKFVDIDKHLRDKSQAFKYATVDFLKTSNNFELF